MANKDRPYGIWPLRHLSGGDCNRQNEYPIASGYAANICTNDPVVLAASGTVELAAAGDVNLLGRFNGCSYVNAQGEQIFSKHWPTGTVATEIKANVQDDPDIVYGIQSTTGGNPQQTNVGNRADIVATAGDVTLGVSRMELSGTMGTGTAQMTILGLVADPSNAFGEHADLEVIFNEHIFKQTGGI